MENAEAKRKTCCFFGHRKIEETEELKTRLYKTIENLIIYKGIDTFLFGSRSEFDDLCLETVTKLKEKYPQIRRIYVRAEFAEIDESYKSYLLQSYEDTYYPERIKNAGRAVYAERNCDMINKSAVCIICYDEKYIPPKRKNGGITEYQPKSGTKLAYEYAKKKELEIINVMK